MNKKDIQKLVINRVENQDVYNYLNTSGQVEEDQLYLVGGDKNFPKITESDNGKVLGVDESGNWILVNQPTVLTKLSELEEDTSHRVVSDAEKAGWDAKQEALTADVDYLTPGTASTTYATKADINNVYKVKGSVANFESLPAENNVVGDVYNTIDSNINYVWTEDGWDPLGMVIDLSQYQTLLTADEDYLTPETAKEWFVPDWEENDDTKTSYVANRTHWKEEVDGETVYHTIDKNYLPDDVGAVIEIIRWSEEEI